MKVYILTTDFNYGDGMYGIETEVFGTKRIAQEAMRKHYDTWLEDEDGQLPEWWEKSSDEDSITLFESGNYDTNHCCWWVMEREVQQSEADDEKGSGGLWDKAAEIALKIANHIDPNNTKPHFAEDFGQEIIYNALKEVTL